MLVDFDEKTTGDGLLHWTKRYGLWSDILASFKLEHLNDEFVSYKHTASLRYEDVTMSMIRKEEEGVGLTAAGFYSGFSYTNRKSRY